MLERLLDVKQHWKFINTKLKEKVKNNDVSQIRNNNIFLKDKKQVANTLNN